MLWVDVRGAHGENPWPSEASCSFGMAGEAGLAGSHPLRQRADSLLSLPATCPGILPPRVLGPLTPQPSLSHPAACEKPLLFVDIEGDGGCLATCTMKGFRHLWVCVRMRSWLSRWRAEPSSPAAASGPAGRGRGGGASRATAVF